MSLRSTFLPRALHPVAWWVWALGLGVAASRTTNPLLLLLIVAVAGYVVAARRTSAPWSRSYAAFLRLGLVVIALRVALEVVFGGAGLGPVLVRLPEVPLPGFLAGVRLGGAVTADGLLGAVYEGLRLATLLACVGAANALANPSRLLRIVPGAVYEVGVAVVVAMTLAPQMVGDVDRIRRARRLRGRPDRGLRGLGGVALPVLEGALDRSLQLAAAMDSRGYGRSAGQSAAARRVTAGLVLAGVTGAAAGAYGLLDGGSPMWSASRSWVSRCSWSGQPRPQPGWCSVAAESPAAGTAPTLGRVPEWLVSASGVVAAVATLVAAAGGTAGLTAPVAPPAWPVLPLLPALGIAVALLPAWVAPPVPAALRPSPRRPSARAGARSMPAPGPVREKVAA